MTIEMLDRGTILVSLENEELRDYSLDFSGPVKTVEQGLRRLILCVRERCGLDPGGKSWLIEALPSHGGCLLIISVHAVRRRRRYRIKRPFTDTMCVFFSADAMLDFLPIAGEFLSGYRLYRYQERYVLLPEGDGEHPILGEYGDLTEASAAAVARVREFGVLLGEKRFQSRRISRGTVTVRDAAPRRPACGGEDLV